MKQWTYDKVGNITMSVGERTGSLSHRYGYGYDYDMTYAYDLNGNLAHESVARKRLDGDTTHNISERKLLWDGMNRLKAISENGYVSLYWHDADGNRTVKEHGGGEAVWVNSKHAGTTTDTVTYSIYPNPYFSVSGNRWTKHYYIGGERFASKTGFISGGFGGLSTTENKVAGHDSGMTIRYDNMRDAEEDSIDSTYARLGVPYGAHHTNTRGDGWHLYLPSTQDDYNVVDGSGGDLRGSHPLTLGDGQVYFYHRDHLGSTMSVTDSLGNTVQQVEYTPWGEVFVERRFGTSDFDTPYLFNGKELDEETGLYYYGARYYDPKMSVWYSVDPLSNYDPLSNENHLDGKHNNGVFNHGNLNPYIYCYNSPIKYLDPNGEQVVAVHGTWSSPKTWNQPNSIFNFAKKIFHNTVDDYSFKWSGGNYKSMRTKAANKLISHIKALRTNIKNKEPITIVGHSHGGNIAIEAINKMVTMKEFDNVAINLITINTPVREDYQLGERLKQKQLNI